MKVIKRTDEYTIFQRRDSRYAVRDAQRAWVNGDAKVAILREHDLIKAPAVKAAPADEPADEPAAETDAADTAAEHPAEGAAE